MTELILSVADTSLIRAINWAKGMSGEVAVDIIKRWNRGQTSRHIAADLGLRDPQVAARVVAVVRSKCPDTPLRAAVQHGTRKVPEADEWWTEARTALARKLFTETEAHPDLIAQRLGTTKGALWAKIKAARWKRTRLTNGKTAGSSTHGNNLQKSIEGRAKATNLVVFQPLADSEPVEFWRLEPGRCCFVLEDKPGNMSEALCCNRQIAAEAPRGHRYCPDHPGGTFTGYEDPLAAGKRTATAKDLDRLARSFG